MPAMTHAAKRLASQFSSLARAYLPAPILWPAIVAAATANPYPGRNEKASMDKPT